MSATRWVDREITSLDEALELIKIGKQALSEEENDTSTYKNCATKIKYDNNQTIVLNGRDISYNFVTFSVDQITPGPQPEIDRTRQIEGFVILYFNGTVNYIINRNSDAQRILRRIMGYSGKKEINKNMPVITSDMFFWLISKVYSGEDILENDEINFNVEIIRGIKGDTDDSLSKVSADGETVLNIISTLSFFLESKNLNRVKMDISFRDHDSIELVLNTNNTITTEEQKYIGPYINDEDLESCKAKLYLLTYIEIIPLLIQEYLSSIENGIWNKERKVEFLNEVAIELSERVEQKIIALQQA